MILLDTHVLIWWMNGEHYKLSDSALAAIELQNQARLLSAVSCWEVAMLIEWSILGLIIHCERWLALLASVPRQQLLPGTFNPDPADRFLVAQARELAIPLVSADSKIRTYPHEQTLW